MVILFVAQITAAIFVFALGDKIIDMVVPDSSKEVDLLKKKLHSYLNYVAYYSIAVIVIVLLEMAFSVCYIGSLRNKNYEFDYKVLD